MPLLTIDIYRLTMSIPRDTCTVAGCVLADDSSIEVMTIGVMTIANLLTECCFKTVRIGCVRP